MTSKNKLKDGLEERIQERVNKLKSRLAYRAFLSEFKCLINFSLKMGSDLKIPAFLRRGN